MAMRWVTTNVRFDPRDYADLQRLAAASGNSLAECVRLAVGAYLGRPGEAGEAHAVYETGGAEALEPEVPAVVHGRTLQLERPLTGFREGARVWVRCVGEAEIAQRHRHRRVIADLLAEFEGMTPGKPAPVGDDDKEIYRP